MYETYKYFKESYISALRKKYGGRKRYGDPWRKTECLLREKELDGMLILMNREGAIDSGTYYRESKEVSEMFDAENIAEWRWEDADR